MTAGQGITLSLILQGVQGGGSVPAIDVPGLLISHRGSQNQLRSVNGRVAYSQIHQYQVLAPSPGRYPIGPLTLPLGAGESATTNLVTLLVLDRVATAGRPATLEAAAALTPDVAWEGQVVLWTWSVRSPSELLHVEATSPDFDGLRLVPYGSPKSRVYQVDDPAGTIWAAEQSTPLVAVATGERPQPGAALRVTVPDDVRSIGFGIRRDRREAVAVPGVAIRIRPLPTPPPAFSGLVGDFRLRSRFDPTGAAVGSSLKWRIDLTGDGDVGGFALPTFPADPAVQVYEADHSLRGAVQDGSWVAVATFDRAVVPGRAGRIALPPLELVVFSPSKGSFETLRAEIQPFEVAAGRESVGDLESFAAPGAPSPPVAAPAIRPIYRWGRDHAAPVGTLLPFALVVAAGPGVGIGLLSVVERFRSWKERRRVRALRPPTAAEALGRLPTEPEARLAALDAVIRLALAARVQVEVVALDRAAALASLPDPLRERVAEVSRLLDRARFAGDPSDDLLADVRAVVALLEGSS